MMVETIALIYLIGFALALILLIVASRETGWNRAGNRAINWRRTDAEMLTVAALWPVVLVLWIVYFLTPNRSRR